MNYSTLKKTVALSFASLMVVGIVNAQTDSTKTTTATTTSSETTTPKVFGGLGQYKKFSIGVNVGATAPSVATGGSNDFTHNKVQLGYGISFREQLAHSFGLQLDLHGGKVEGNNSKDPGNTYSAASFQTKFWSGTLSGVVNVATIDFLRRKNSVNFFVTAGGGLALYTPKVTYKNGTVVDFDGHAGNSNGTGTSKYVKELIIPVGAGVKFRLSDVVALNLGYTETFVDGDNFDGVNRA